MDIATHLSHMLKALRQARGWSLSQAAEKTGVSKAMLGQIERNESSPTVATLWKIATGLNVPLSVFIEAPGTARPVYDLQQQTMVITPIFPYDAQSRFDLFAITLAPGCQSDSSPHDTGVMEHVVVIDGVLALCIDGVWHTLGPGQGQRFAGDVPHIYRNPDERAVRFHSLIHYPPSIV